MKRGTPCTTDMSSLKSEFNLSTLPTAIEAEKAVVGALLVDAPYANNICLEAGLEGQHFVNPIHAVIYDTITSQITSGKVVDAIWLHGELALTHQGIPLHLLTELATFVPSLIPLAGWVRHVQAAFVRRGVQIALGNGVRALQDGVSTMAVLEDVQSELQRLAKGVSIRESRTYKQLLQDGLHRYIEGDDANRIIKTGFAALDEMSAIGAKDMITIGGRAKSGKTIFALNIIANIANASLSQPKNRILIVSLEMSAPQIIDRLVANQSGLTTKRLRAGRLQTEGELRAMEKAMNTLSEWNLVVRDDIQELSAIISTARAMAGQPKGLKVLMVDYLQLVKVPRRDIREQEVAEVSRALRLLALETGVLVLALIQLNSNGTARESAAIWMDATAIWNISSVNTAGELAEKGDNSDESRRMIVIPFQRDDQSGVSCMVRFDGARARISAE